MKSLILSVVIMLQSIPKKQFSNQIRELICSKYYLGTGPKEIGNELNINPKNVSSVLTTYKNTGRIHAIASKSGRPKILTDDHVSIMKEQIHEDVLTTLNTMKLKLHDEYDVTVSTATMHRAIAKFIRKVTRREDF